MENKNYYPLTVSTNPKVHETGYCSIWSEVNGCAINLVKECEITIAQQLIEAYNEKYGPKENSAHSFTEGSDVWNDPKWHGWVWRVKVMLGGTW